MYLLNVSPLCMKPLPRHFLHLQTCHSHSVHLIAFFHLHVPFKREIQRSEKNTGSGWFWKEPLELENSHSSSRRPHKEWNGSKHVTQRCTSKILQPYIDCLRTLDREHCLHRQAFGIVTSQCDLHNLVAPFSKMVAHECSSHCFRKLSWLCCFVMPFLDFSRWLGIPSDERTCNDCVK